MGTTQKPSKAKWKKASWSEWISLFNRIHNPFMFTSVGTIKVKIDDKEED